MSYSIENYDRPSVTADITVFRLRNDDPEDYRRTGKPHLSLLLIRRGIEPFKGMWALPGGFLRRGETIEECAVRELREETGLTPVSIEPIGVFSKSDRDPRGWILSNAFMAILSTDQCADVTGGTDASEAAWFDVESVTDGDERTIRFRCGDVSFAARLRACGSRYGRTAYELSDRDELAFDHAEIVALAIDVLKSQVTRYDAVFRFLPERFTLSGVQSAQEAVLQKTDAPANFRRKITDYVVETDEYETGPGHRPAKLFQRKTDL